MQKITTVSAIFFCGNKEVLSCSCGSFIPQLAVEPKPKLTREILQFYPTAVGSCCRTKAKTSLPKLTCEISWFEQICPGLQVVLLPRRLRILHMALQLHWPANHVYSMMSFCWKRGESQFRNRRLQRTINVLLVM